MIIRVAHRVRPTVRITTSQSPVDEAARHLVTRVNAERRQRHLPELQAATGLDAAARVRVDEVVQMFAHQRPSGTLGQLLTDAGVGWSLLGENLARVTAPSALAASVQAHAGLMASAGHRQNVLRPEFRHLAVAVRQQGRRWYVVQLFCD